MSRILVIEDSEGQRAEVRAALEGSGLFEEVLEADDGFQGLRLLVSEAPDMVLCDLEMPGLDGEKLLRMNRARDESVPVPFLVLTAVQDPERRARLLEQGASDAITKPFHTADLVARIGLHLKLVAARRELVEKNEALARLSRTDALTDLANRRAIEEVLHAEFLRSSRYGVPFAVVLADVDRFKGVNDEHGHPVGDQVLVEIARTMSEIIRETDCAGRYGGEEFLAVLGNNDCQGARVFAERWRRTVEAISVELPNGETLSPTISLGVAEWRPGVADVQSIVERADQALYRAKQTGRNRTVVDPEAEGGEGAGAEGESTPD